MSNLKFGDTFYFNHYVLTNPKDGYIELDRVSEEEYELSIFRTVNSPIETLKITDFSLLEWIDNWKEDPKIKKLNLSNNQLTKVYIPKPREFLMELNLRNNVQLTELIIESAPQLRSLNIEECFRLETIRIFNSPLITNINALNCKLSNPQVDSLMETISVNTIWRTRGRIDLRGNERPTRSSKLEILLNSNWEVLFE